MASETVIQLAPNPSAGKDGDTIRTTGWVGVIEGGCLRVESYSDAAAESSGCPPNVVLTLAPGTWRSYKTTQPGLF